MLNPEETYSLTQQEQSIVRLSGLNIKKLSETQVSDSFLKELINPVQSLELVTVISIT